MAIDIQRFVEFDFLRATEIAALNCMGWMGKGDKEAADAAACDAIRGMFDITDVCGEVVIGEGIKTRRRGSSRGSGSACGGTACRATTSPSTRSTARLTSPTPSASERSGAVGKHAWEIVEGTGLDAALGIEDVMGKLERVVTGTCCC
jgi:hypothetical protein